MWTRFTRYDLRVIAHYLGALTLFFSIALIVPFVTAMVFAEWEPAGRYLFAIGFSLVVGSGLRLMRIEPGRLTHQQALAVTGLAWILLAFIASVPLFFSGHYATYTDALFEGVSGLTTTGASLVTDLEHLSYADNMWRFVMHFLGGLGLIVVALSLGILGRQGSSGLYSTEGRREHVVPNVVNTARFIALFSGVAILLATVALTIFCLFAGIEPVRAFLQSLWVATSGFMTAGFTPMSASILYYHSFPVEVVCVLIMLLGAINFVLYAEVWKGNTLAFKKDLEIRTAVTWLSVILIVMMSALAISTTYSDLPAMIRRGIFMLCSAATTTGFQSITSTQLAAVIPSGTFLLLAVAMAVGGSAGSTAGGIKVNRIGIIVKSMVATVKETISPDSARVSVTYTHIRKQVLDSETVREAMTVSALFVVTYLVGALVGIAHGYDAMSAIFESVSMASNGGLTSGIVEPGMPFSLEVFYIFEMWAGRLEFVTLIALIVKVLVSLKPRKRLEFGDRR